MWDSLGRQVAFKTTGDVTWSCVGYDARGRATARAWPAYGGTPARAEATTYTTTGSKTTLSGITVKTTDTEATTATPNARVPVESTVDLLGRVWRYVDEWGTVTTIDYDQAGRQTAVRVRRAGASTDDLTLGYTYVASGAGVNQLSTQTVDGTTAATVSYDAVGRQAGITYSNGTSKTAPGFDVYQRATTAEFKKGSTLITSDELTYQAVTGRVVDQKADGQANYTGGADFSYDNAGRLTNWWGRDPATANAYRGTIRYDDYTTTPACATAAKASWGRDSNRLEQRVRRYSDNNAATLLGDGTDTSCYDNADRLTTHNPASGSNPWSSPVYDSHGNLTSSGSETRGYDSADRHLSTTATVAASTPTPTVVATSKVQAAGGSGALAVPKPAGLQVGDLVVVFVTHDAAQWMPTPSGFTFGDYADNYGSGMSPQMRAVFFYKTATATDVSGSGWTFTVPGPPATTSTAVAGAFRGVDTTGSNDLVWADGNFDNGGAGGWSDNWSGNATATSLTVPQVTTQGVNRLLVTFTAAASNGVTFTPPSGFTEQGDTSYLTGRNIEIASKTQAAAGPSGAPTTTASTGSGLVGFHFALKPQTTGATTTTVAYNRDVADRVIERKLGGVTQQRYTHTAAGDSPTLTLDAANNVVEKTITLPGGVLWTKRAGGGDVWSYPNLHGDITATTNATGVKQGGTRTYDPYGNPLGTATLVDNSAGNWDYTWHGTQQRPLEHEPNLTPVIEMGARQYSTQLGRFLETDPIEGGTPNDYTYVADPIGSADLTGACEVQIPGLGTIFTLGARSQGCASALRGRAESVRRALERYADDVSVFAGLVEGGCLALAATEVGAPIGLPCAAMAGAVSALSSTTHSIATCMGRRDRYCARSVSATTFNLSTAGLGLSAARFGVYFRTLLWGLFAQLNRIFDTRERPYRCPADGCGRRRR